MSHEEDGGSLYVLTAVLLTPTQFPAVFGDDFPEACALLGVPPAVDGYGLVLGQDEEGARWTVVVDDVSLVATAIASWDCGMEYELSPDERTIVVSLAGWPLELTVAAPGIPAPHDPEQGADGTGRVPLAPPSGEAWGPVQRRLGADQIAREWADWRERVATDGGAARRRTPGWRGRCGRPRGTPGRHRRRAGSGPPSPVRARGPSGPTGPAGRWSPGPATRLSSCWTRSPVRCWPCPTRADSACRNSPTSPSCWRRWTASPSARPDPRDGCRCRADRGSPRRGLEGAELVLHRPAVTEVPHESLQRGHGLLVEELLALLGPG